MGGGRSNSTPIAPPCPVCQDPRTQQEVVPRLSHGNRMETASGPQAPSTCTTATSALGALKKKSLSKPQTPAPSVPHSDPSPSVLYALAPLMASLPSGLPSEHSPAFEFCFKSLRCRDWGQRMEPVLELSLLGALNLKTQYLMHLHTDGQLCFILCKDQMIQSRLRDLLLAPPPFIKCL